MSRRNPKIQVMPNDTNMMMPILASGMFSLWRRPLRLDLDFNALMTKEKQIVLINNISPTGNIRAMKKLCSSNQQMVLLGRSSEVP